MSGSVLVRCDGSPEIGLGHVVRCLALAQELRDSHGSEVSFAMREGPLGMDLVREAGFRVTEAAPGEVVDYADWLCRAAEEVAADVMVLDVRDGLSLADVRAVRGRTRARIAVLDDASEKRLAADCVFYPPVPQVASLSWPGFTGRVFIGWEWVSLRREFAAAPRRVRGTPPNVLVTMGGTDPAGLTVMAVSALALVQRPIDCTVLVGRGFRHDALLEPALCSLPHECSVVRDGDVRRRLLTADLAVLSFGVTAYEAAASALPAVHLCLTADHALSSSAFVDARIAVSLGVVANVSQSRIAETVERLLADPEGTRHMGARARTMVDGKGAARVAEVLADGRLD